MLYVYDVYYITLFRFVMQCNVLYTQYAQCVHVDVYPYVYVMYPYLSLYICILVFVSVAAYVKTIVYVKCNNSM